MYFLPVIFATCIALQYLFRENIVTELCIIYTLEFYEETLLKEFLSNSNPITVEQLQFKVFT